MNISSHIATNKLLLSKRSLNYIALIPLLFFSSLAKAEFYTIDTLMSHAFIEFRIQHLGFSWMSGRFNDFDGNFVYDESNPKANKVNVEIDVASIDTNHSLRDKHLRGEKYLDVEQFPKAYFKSTSYEVLEGDRMEIWGELTLHGITKEIKLSGKQIGYGDDPWGGFRRGFFATTKFEIADFGIDVEHLGEASQSIYLDLSVEGLRQSLSNEAKPTPFK